MIFLGFDKEYMNQSEESEDVVDDIVAPINEAAKLAEEREKTIAEEAGEDEAQDPPLEL